VKTLLCALACLLTGCALGPDNHRPALNVPATFRGAEVASPEAAPGATSGPVPPSVADQLWQDVYPDAALQKLLTAALRNNLDLRIAVAHIDEARAALGQARLGLLPTLDVRGSVARTETSSDALLPGAARIRNSEEADLLASYELDFWGRLRRTHEAARASLLSSEYARRAVTVTLVANVANAYFTLLALDSQLSITRRTVESRDKFVELTRAQHERGYATGLDVATAEAQAAVARANVPDLERRTGELENQICLLLGENPHAIERASNGEAMPAAPALPPVGLPSALLERRPDLVAAEQALRAANANVGVAKAALFPTLTLTGLAGSLSAPLGSLFNPATAEWSAAAGLVQPLLDPQRSLYQLDLAQARKREALLSYQQVVQTSFQESADALLAYAKYGEFEHQQAIQVEALRRADAIALARYRSGYASYFDVINADRDLFTAELTLTQARANNLTAFVRLYQVLGGGWEPPPAVHAPK